MTSLASDTTTRRLLAGAVDVDTDLASETIFEDRPGLSLVFARETPFETASLIIDRGLRVAVPGANFQLLSLRAAKTWSVSNTEAPDLPSVDIDPVTY